MKQKIALQKIYINSNTLDETKDMFYRVGNQICQTDIGAWKLDKNNFFDYTTYFNTLSLKKWKQYTFGEEFFLELYIKGKFRLSLVGHYINSRGDIRRENIRTYYYNVKEFEKIIIKIPNEVESTIVAFQIETISNVYILDAQYTSLISNSNLNRTNITLVTTTYKKEKYIKNNIDILKETIFSEPEYKDFFHWKIIDNGQTLESKFWDDEKIEIIPNKNVGGSGGFTRGMIEALTDERHPTHILLMDDDVKFFPDAFRRVFALLSMIRPEYKDYFISGAMLEINERNIQHEDVGLFSNMGEHGPIKPRLDMNNWDSIVRNEEYEVNSEHSYAGWWFCCIPTAVASLDNLPLPLFVRGDDVEYSIRNHAKFITMNGICIWHEGFGTKFSASLELYQVHRNDLILQAMNEDETADIDIIDRIKWLFWEEMYKFNYKGAELLLDSIEDFLKGPNFIESLDGEKCMKEKKAKDNILLPITPEIEAKVNYDELYINKPMKRLAKFVYDHSCNGQRLPKIFCKKDEGIIPYGWGYYQEKMNFKKCIYAIDPINRSYVKYERNNSEYTRLRKRFNVLMEKYSNNYNEVKNSYLEKKELFVSVDFWKRYLANE